MRSLDVLYPESAYSPRRGRMILSSLLECAGDVTDDVLIPGQRKG